MDAPEVHLAIGEIASAIRRLVDHQLRASDGATWLSVDTAVCSLQCALVTLEQLSGTAGARTTTTQ